MRLSVDVDQQRIIDFISDSRIWNGYYNSPIMIRESWKPSFHCEMFLRCMDNGKFIGYLIGVDYGFGALDTHIIVNPEYRGQGRMMEMLVAGLKWVKRHAHGYRVLLARVDPEKQHIIKAAKKLNFELITKDDGTEFLKLHIRG